MENLRPENLESDKPMEVRSAIKILFVSLGIGVANSIFGLYQEYSSLESSTLAALGSRALPFGVFIIAFGMLFELFIIVKISRGRNWARVLYVILFIVGIPFWALGIVDDFKRAPIVMGVSSILLFLQVWAAILLFKQASNNWFNKMKSLSIAVTE